MEILSVDIKFLDYKNKICNETFYTLEKNYKIYYQILTIKKRNYLVNNYKNLEVFIKDKLKSKNSRRITIEKIFNHFIIYKPDNSNHPIIKSFYIKINNLFENKKYKELVDEIIFILENFLFENLFIKNILNQFQTLINILCDVFSGFNRYLKRNDFFIKLKMSNFKNYFSFCDFVENNKSFTDKLIIQCLLNLNYYENFQIMNYYIFYQLSSNKPIFFSNLFILFGYKDFYYKDYSSLFMLKFYKNNNLVDSSLIYNFKKVFEYKNMIFSSIDLKEKLKDFDKKIINFNNCLNYSYMNYLTPYVKEIHNTYNCTNTFFSELYHLWHLNEENVFLSDCFKIDNNLFNLFTIFINYFNFNFDNSLNKIITIIKKIVYLIYSNNKKLKDVSICFYIMHKFLKKLKSFSRNNSFNNINEIFSYLSGVSSIFAIKKNDFYKSNIYFLKYIFPNQDAKLAIYQLCFLVSPTNIFDIYFHNNIMKSMHNKNFKYFDILKIIKGMLEYDDDEKANLIFEELLADVVETIMDDLKDNVDEEILNLFELRFKENYFYDIIIKLIKNIEIDVKNNYKNNNTFEMEKYNSIQYYNFKDFLWKIKKTTNLDIIIKNRVSCFVDHYSYISFLEKYKFVRIFKPEDLILDKEIDFNKKFRKHFNIRLYDGLIKKNKQNICILEILIINWNIIELFFKNNLEIFKIYNPKFLNILGVYIDKNKNHQITWNFVFDQFDSFLFEEKKYVNNFFVNLFSLKNNNFDQELNLKHAFEIYELFISNYIFKINLGLLLPTFITLKDKDIKIIPPILFYYFIDFSKFYKFVINKHIGTNFIKTLFNDKIKHKNININLVYLHPEIIIDFDEEGKDNFNYNFDIEINNSFKFSLMDNLNNKFHYDLYSILMIIIKLLLPLEFKTLKKYELKSYLTNRNQYKEKVTSILIKLNELLDNKFDFTSLFSNFEGINLCNIYKNLKGIIYEKNFEKNPILSKKSYNKKILYNYSKNFIEYSYLPNNMIFNKKKNTISFDNKTINFENILNFDEIGFNPMSLLFFSKNLLDNNSKLDDLDLFLKISEDILLKYSNNKKEYIYDIFGNFFYFEQLNKKIIFKNSEKLNQFLIIETVFPFKNKSKIVFDLINSNFLLFNEKKFILYFLENYDEIWNYKNLNNYIDRLFDLFDYRFFYFKINCQSLLFKNYGYFNGTMIGDKYYEGVYRDKDNEIIYNNINNYFYQEVIFNNFYIETDLNYILLKKKKEYWSYKGWCKDINPDFFGKFIINNFKYIGEIKNLKLYKTGELISGKKNIKFIFNRGKKLFVLVNTNLPNDKNILIGQAKSNDDGNFNSLNLKDAILKLNEYELSIEGIKYSKINENSIVNFGLFKFTNKSNQISNFYKSIIYLKDNYIFTGSNFKNQFLIGELTNNVKNLKSFGILWNSADITIFKGIINYGNKKKFIYFLNKKDFYNIVFNNYDNNFYKLILNVLKKKISLIDIYEFKNNILIENIDKNKGFYYENTVIYKKIIIPNFEENYIIFNKNIFKGLSQKNTKLRMVKTNNTSNICFIYNQDFIFKGFFNEEKLKLIGEIYNKFQILIFEGKINLTKDTQVGNFYKNKNESHLGKYKYFKLNSYGIIKKNNKTLYSYFKNGIWQKTSFKINNLKNKIISLDIRNKKFKKLKTYKLLGNKVIEKDKGKITKIYVN